MQLPASEELIERFRTCCNLVIEHCTDRYALAFAKAGLKFDGYHEIRSQALYIVANLNTWRGETARNTKKILREIGE
jgi:hypothetical protein